LWIKERKKVSRNNRADVYLLGFGGRARFESPIEFAFHAVWLYVDEYHDTYPCECTLDTGRGQSEINRIWLRQLSAPEKRTRTAGRSAWGRGVTGGSGGGGGGGGGRRGSRDIRVDEAEPRGDFLDPGPKVVTWQPSKRCLLDGPPTESDIEDQGEDSEGDDLAGHPMRESGHRSLRPFKNMELVWIKIPRIEARAGSEPITLWPALVVDSGPQPGHAAAHQYEVRLLGVDSKHIVPETSVFPYQIKPLTRKAPVTSVRRVLPGNITSWDQVQRFHPIPPPSNSPASETALPRTEANAAGPLKLGKTVAQSIAVQFSLMGQHVGDAADRNAPQQYKWAWLGPQRIEPGDMIRLVPNRDKLADLGFPTMELLEESTGADKTCLFVKVVSIRLNERTEPGFVGHLFELTPGRVEAHDPLPFNLPVAPKQHIFRLISSLDSPGFFKFFWVAGRYEYITFQSEAHSNFIENNLLNKQHIPYWNIQYHRGKELPQPVKHVLSLTGLGPGGWNALTYKPVTVTGRQAGIQHAVKEARKMYFGDEDHFSSSSDDDASDSEIDS
ncbi:hypothetical protein FRB90_006257, partial [Tulasnella sp. 427]